MNSLLTALFVLPFVCVIISAFLFHKDAAGSPSAPRWKLIGGVGILVPVLGLIAYGTVLVDLGVVVAIILIFMLSIWAFCTGLVLFSFPIRRSKVYGALLGVGFPLIMMGTLLLSNNFNPDIRTKNHGVQISTALDHYKKDHGHFPTALKELVPDYIARFNHPNDLGWLYTSDGQEFSLGYVTYVDKFGYSVSFMRSNSRVWEYVHEDADPFHVGPTPYPATTPDW